MGDRPTSMKKRGGRPNRNGGRGNRRGGGGHGRGSGRGHSQGRGRGSGGFMPRKGCDDYDDDVPVNWASNEDDYDNRGSYFSRPASSASAASYDRPKPAPKMRLTMQHLHMSRENQEMVKDMLYSLRGEELQAKDEEEYNELDVRHDNQYWTTGRKLQVEDVLNFSQGYVVEPQETLPESADVDDKVEAVTFRDVRGQNHFAVQKLVRCGFEKDQCIEALQLKDGDIGASLEYLLCQAFQIELEDEEDGAARARKRKGDPEWEAAMEERREEMMALKSIYEERFEERVPNQVWVVHLDLDHLAKLCNPDKPVGGKASRGRGRGSDKEDTRPLCAFYLRGNCRFGSRCRQRHENPSLPVSSHPQSKDEPQSKMLTKFRLEVRFPLGNMYPYEAPLIAFSSTIGNFPPHVCLTLSRFLYGQAMELAESHQPAVFALVNFFNDDDLINDLYNQPKAPIAPLQPAISQRKRRTDGVNGAAASGFDAGSGGIDADAATDSMIRMVERDEKRRDAVEEEQVPVKKSSRKDIGHDHYSDAEIVKQNKRVKDEFRRVQKSQAYLKMQEQRQKLPAWDMREKILKVLKDTQVLVISGMTGCGKTTQVPQFILEQHLQSNDLKMCNVVCTQPRRISALAVADRVAQERAGRVGGLVGYQIRLENRQSASTRLLFCTTGIILRRLEGDAMLEGITHIIVDEVHERSEDSDFLLMILRKTLPLRPDLKVILMSATLNAELFSQYFGGCPVIEIPGRTYPVEQLFLEDAIEMTGYVMEESSPFARPLKRANAVRMGGQGKGGHLSVDDINQEVERALHDCSGDPPRDKLKDMNLNVKQLFMRYTEVSKSTVKTMAMMDFEKINYDLIVELLEFIVQGRHEYPKDGAILVFLPGFAEIQTLYDMLQANSFFNHRGKGRFKIIPLHSTLSSEDQQSVFVKPREGVRKIVISTNIAETSITIDDVVFVIDCGRMKEKRYDAMKSMESLETVWVSCANALQRKGRAGRVTSGVCFHLFTSHQFHHHLADQPVPEIQRVPLEKLILKVKMLEVFKKNSVEEVIEDLLEPPKMDSVFSSLRRLQDLGALDDHKELTSLGYHLGSLPVDVRVGKLMLFGAIFRCLDSALTIAATLSFKSPFVAPFDKKDEADKKRKEFAVGNSDHLSMLNAYNAYMDARQKSSGAAYFFCQENYLSIKTLQMLASLKQQFVELLSDIGFVHEGIGLRDVERAARTEGRDGVISATGLEANVNSSNLKLVSAILVGALYPNVVQVLTPETRYSMASSGAVPKAPKPDEMKFKTKSDGYVSVHPSSVNFQVRHYDSPFLVYHEKVKTSKVYIRDCTMVSVYPLLLFGGGSISVDLERGNFVLSVDDGWIRFQVASVEVGELVRELRTELDQLLADKINSPNMDLAVCPRGSRIIAAIVKLITTQ